MGQEISVNIGPVQIPENRIWRLICWLPRTISGTGSLQRDVKNLTQHISAMTDILHIILADLSGSWDATKRERVQRMVAKFTLINKGLETAVAKGNPITAEELERLRSYTRRAQEGQVFAPDEALDYKQLAERTSRDYVGQDWVAELLKAALFIFALYAFGKALSQNK
jgi:hypothetical protein